ncbi:MAG: alpha/beta fold hydrolase [Acidobacteria bacterium]|nr:alpha/beta fold hydrolase [Acidobacteriota bacterium]
MPDAFAISFEEGTVSALEYPAATRRRGATLILAHGAGAGQRHPFMRGFAEALAERGVDVLTFDFPYMAQHRRLPDRSDVLERCYLAAIEATWARHERSRLFIGGKSMGGRIASQVAARADRPDALAGLIFLGYPLHPPGRPSQTRAKHFPAITAPMLFVQGTRDAFGTPAELRPFLQGLSTRADAHAVEGGDHSFAVPKSSALPQRQVFERAQNAIAEWIG